MSLDPTASEFFFRSSVKKYFIDSLKTTEEMSPEERFIVLPLRKHLQPTIIFSVVSIPPLDYQFRHEYTLLFH